jgi:hypothetical protein
LISKATNLKFPGLLTLAYHVKDTYKDYKYRPTDETSYNFPWECGIEASYDFEKKDIDNVKVGSKVSCGTSYIAQAMIDKDFKVSSAFTYTPNPNFKFIWSDNLNFKALFTQPTAKFYTYGFTFEYDHSI